MTIYAFYLWEEKGQDWAITSHDFPGFVAQGATPDEAARAAIKGAGFHMQSLIKQKRDIPAPAPFAQVKDALASDSNSEAATIILLDVPNPSDKTVRCNVTLPASLVSMIDAEASARSTTRSGYIKNLALQDLGIEQ